MSGMEEGATPFLSSGAYRFRSFGLFGPAYEVLSADEKLARIRVLESGEELDYPMDKLKEDPEV